MKFSTLIGKKVISLYDRCIAGVTIGATFKDNLRKISHLVVEDNLEDVSYYLKGSNLSFSTYDKSEELFKAVTDGEVNE